MTKMTDALQSLQDQYIFLTNNLSTLKQACAGDANATNALMTQYVTCRRNYFNCVNKVFHDDDPSVQQLVQQMKAQQQALNNATAQLGGIAGIISAITNAVQTGTQLAAL
jgi:uncharacterized protein YukE